jgi:hypothetical protein
MAAASTIFCSGAGTGAFLPVMSEMKNPKDYKKAVNWCMGFVTAAVSSPILPHKRLVVDRM